MTNKRNILLIVIFACLILLTFAISYCDKNEEITGGDPAKGVDPYIESTIPTQTTSDEPTTTTSNNPTTYDIELVECGGDCIKIIRNNCTYDFYGDDGYYNTKASYNGITIKNNGPADFTDKTPFSISIYLSSTETFDSNEAKLLVKYTDSGSLDYINEENPLRAGGVFSIPGEYIFSRNIANSPAGGWHVFATVSSINSDTNSKNNTQVHIGTLKVDYSGDKMFSVLTNSKNNVNTMLMLFTKELGEPGYEAEAKTAEIPWTGEKNNWVVQYIHTYLNSELLCPYYLTYYQTLNYDNCSEVSLFAENYNQQFLASGWASKSAVMSKYLNTTNGVYYIRCSLSLFADDTPADYKYMICLKETGDITEINYESEIDDFFNTSKIEETASYVTHPGLTVNSAVQLTPLKANADDPYNGTKYYTEFADPSHVHWYKIQF